MAGISTQIGTQTDSDNGTSGPQDLSDVLGFDTQINRGGNRPIRPGGSNRGGIRPPPTGGIDLSKTPEIDMGRKPSPRSAIGIEAGKSAGGGLNVTVEVPIGGPIGIRGGVNLGEGGAIKGGQVGLGIGKGPIGASVDIGTDQNEKGEGGCYQYITVSIGPFSHTIGRNVCEPKSPRDISGATPPAKPGIGNSDVNSVKSLLKNNCLYYVIYFQHPRGVRLVFEKPLVKTGEHPFFSGGIWTSTGNLLSQENLDLSHVSPGYIVWHDYPTRPDRAGYKINDVQGFCELVGSGSSSPAAPPNSNEIISYPYNGTAGYLYDYGSGIKNFLNNWVVPEHAWEFSVIQVSCIGDPANTPPKNLTAPENSPSFNSSPSAPPIPNSPIEKKMNDDCCKIQALYSQEILRLMGRPLGKNGELIAISKTGFFGEEKERTETPLNPKDPDKKIKIKFTNYYELAQYFLSQLIAEDVASDPRSFKRPTGKLQNPDYSRDSEESLKKNKQPDKDESGNKRELELDKDIYIQSALQQQQYIFQALKRLEYLFPSGELSDAKIAKSLLIPGAKGDIKIHNMIMFQEIFVQYINATLGDPRQVLRIKDANPALAGDQPLEISALTLADWARQIVKFQIDTGGDVDASVNLMLRDFRTNMANRTDIVKTAEMVQALFEDSGMREQQDYIPLHLEGDPYAGQWIKGQGFKANTDLEKKTEAATEKVLQQTLNPTNIKIKVSRRHKEEKTDMRDLLRGLADFVQRLLSIPTGGDAAKSIDKLIESAKFKIQTDAALLRQNISQAATASRNRTRKKKK